MPKLQFGAALSRRQPIHNTIPKFYLQDKKQKTQLNMEYSHKLIKKILQFAIEIEVGIMYNIYN